MILDAEAFSTARRVGGEAFHEDAEPAAAEARERLLQHYREIHRRGASLAVWPKWQEAALEAVEWICRLAANGHCGAARLRDRILFLGTNRPELGATEPIDASTPLGQELRALAGRVPVFGIAAARLALAGPLRPAREAAQWLDPALAPTFADLWPGAAKPDLAEREIIWEHVCALAGPAAAPPPQALRAAILARRAHAAVASLERAAAKADAQWREDYARAPDKPAFVRAWLATSPDTSGASPRLAMIVGAAYEYGWVGGAPDLDQAIHWYARLPGVARLRSATAAAIDADACAVIGANLELFAENPTLALAWYERGIERGSDACFGRWLRACARADLGVVPDPRAAVARAKAFMAAEPRTIDFGSEAGWSKQYSILGWEGVQMRVMERATRETEEGNFAAAALWLEALAACGSERARGLLKALGPQ